MQEGEGEASEGEKEEWDAEGMGGEEGKGGRK